MLMYCVLILIVSTSARDHNKSTKCKQHRKGMEHTAQACEHVKSL